MIDLISVSEDALTQTIRGIRQEVINRNWQASIPYVGSPHCFIVRGDGKTMHVFSSTPPTTSYAAAHLANDKFATYQVIAAAAIPQPDTVLANSGELDDDALRFMRKHGKIVVKPIDGGHGKGITVGVTTKPQLEVALVEAHAATQSMDRVLLQQQYPHDLPHDVRMLCIDFTFVGAILRVPARVAGDGVHTVGELIKLENESGKRGRAYYAPLAVINTDKAAQYLGEKIDHIPSENTKVQVLGIANYGAGGETIDVTDAIPTWLAECAEKASRACELPVAGVDFLLSRLPSADMSQAELDPVLIEINKCPLLAMHDFPTSGQSRNVLVRYMDYLTSISL